MPDRESLLLFISTWWGRLLLIMLFYLIAWVIFRLSGRIAKRLSQFNRFSREKRRWRPERLTTLQGLIASTTTFFAFTVATLSSLSLFVGADTLIWMVGLFSAAFGLGARPLISDFLTGIGFMFEDTFDVGEKIELPGIGGGVEGVIEAVNLRTTLVRAPTGELLTIPNGEIRLVRNYSRGRFSMADIKLTVPTSEINRAIPLLEALAEEAVTLLPNLLEPWLVISASGAMGQNTELLLSAKARYGQAAEMRPRLLALIQERLEHAQIPIVG
ncbi:MAG: mechanosensitive ion channel family protein [Anaerolineales bacterium]|nr:mechanosensitive ion channel family protein [Anaerolineales bacterium]MCA9930890.1 mechanosensitive ion channel family protein [Anaerolineales bacterium]